MRIKFFALIAALQILLLIPPGNLKAGEPVCHIMICCKACNNGVSFLVNGEWNGNHDYGDINQVRDILQKIKDTGIKTVIIDMTNPSQWTIFWNIFKPMVDNIQLVCREKEMQFFIFIGAQLSNEIKAGCNIPLETDAFEFWNGIAGIIWNTWAQDSVYRRYGFGDNRPMIVAFLPSESYWDQYNGRPEEYKIHLSKFYIGTTQVNDPVTPGETDGWGYRKSIGNPSGTIRFTSPNGGIGPSSWCKITPAAFRTEVKWASEAAHYSIYGSYEDACDAIFWGIAQTRNSTAAYNKYPVDDPFLYYSIIKEIVNPKVQPEAPAFLYATAGNQLIKLDWADNLESEFSGEYRVYRSSKSGGPYAMAAQTSESRFDDNTVVNDSTYYYVVTALDKSNTETSYSNECSATAKKKDNCVYKFDFNKSGNLEGWVGNEQVGGLEQTIGLNGADGVLKSSNGIQDIDPRLFYNNLLPLPEDYQSWKEIEIRLRQIGTDFVTPQHFDPQGTITYFMYPEVFTPGEIKWPAFNMTYEPDGEWVTARADLSAMGKFNVTLLFVDPIGNSPGIGKNFEVDYIYLTAYLLDDTIKTQTPFNNLIIPGAVELEDFDYGGVNVAYLDADFENQGGTYRMTESVDIGSKSGGGNCIGWCKTGEWLEYTVNVSTFGKYKATLHYAAASSGTTVQFSIDDRNIVEPNTLPVTGEDGEWGTFDVLMCLNTGQKVMKFTIVEATENLNLDKVDFSLLEEIQPGTGMGLQKTLWKGELGGRIWFKDSVCTEVDSVIDEVWSDVGPGCGIGKDFWNIRWSGYLEPLFSEEYTLHLTVNDMGRLWVNDVLIIDAWVGTASGKTHSGKISLVAGQKVNIRVDFAEKSGNAMIKLEWESRSNPREVVPRNQLYSDLLDTSVPVAEQGDFVVYPNPASDQITIGSCGRPIESVTITDICGRVVFMHKEPFSGNKTLNIGTWKSGVYFIKANTFETTLLKKFIRE